MELVMKVILLVQWRAACIAVWSTIKTSPWHTKCALRQAEHLFSTITLRSLSSLTF